jgi:hypothetical protein
VCVCVRVCGRGCAREVGAEFEGCYAIGV